MRHRIIFLFLFSLAACSGTPTPLTVPQSTYRNQIQPVVEKHCIRYATAKQTLTVEDEAELADFLDPIPLNAIDRVEVTGNLCCGAQKSSLLAVKRFLVRRGVPRDVIWLVSNPDLDKRITNVVVTYSKVIPPQCGNWSEGATANYSNASLPGFGCITAVNLGQQVAHPSDLLGTDKGAPMDTQRNLSVVETYRGTASAQAASGGATASSSTGAADAASGGATTAPQ